MSKKLEPSSKHSTRFKKTSDTSDSATTTPQYTPSSTPPYNCSRSSQTIDHMEDAGVEDHTEGAKAKPDPKGTESEVSKLRDKTPPIPDSSSTAQSTPEEKQTIISKVNKASCKQHKKGSKKTSKKRSKAKEVDSSSSDDTSDDTSSSSSSEDSEDSLSVDDEAAKKKRKAKAKKAKKLKEKKKIKARKAKAVESDSEDSDDESSSSEDEKEKKKSRKKNALKKKKKRP